MENKKQENVVNFNENGGEIVLDSVNTSSNSRRVLAKISIGYLVFLFLMVIFLMIFFSGPGGGMIGIVFFPFFMIAYVFYPIYFIFLSIRYLREKNELDLYEKIAFFMLLIGLIIWAGSVFLF